MRTGEVYHRAILSRLTRKLPKRLIILENNGFRKAMILGLFGAISSQPDTRDAEAVTIVSTISYGPCGQGSPGAL